MESFPVCVAHVCIWPELVCLPKRVASPVVIPHRDLSLWLEKNKTENGDGKVDTKTCISRFVLRYTRPMHLSSTAGSPHKMFPDTSAVNSAYGLSRPTRLSPRLRYLGTLVLQLNDSGGNYASQPSCLRSATLTCQHFAAPAAAVQRIKLRACVTLSRPQRIKQSALESPLSQTTIPSP